MTDSYTTQRSVDGTNRKPTNSLADGELESKSVNRMYTNRESSMASRGGAMGPFQHQISSIEDGYGANVGYDADQAGRSSLRSPSMYSMVGMGNALPSFQSDVSHQQHLPTQPGSSRQLRSPGTGGSIVYTEPFNQHYTGPQHNVSYAAPAQGQYYAGYPQSGRPMYQQHAPGYHVLSGQHEAYSPTQYSHIGSPLTPNAGPYASLNYQISHGMNNFPVGYTTASHGQQQYHQPSAYRPGQANDGDQSSAPRGPPRKPKQSGFALWVGNLPPGANISDLKDHFSREATRDIESLFLISKSNCAFVNYRTEDACVAAMQRFHDSRFQGIRLVCRLRRGSSASTPSPTLSRDTSNMQKESVPNTASPTTGSMPRNDQLADGVDGIGDVDGAEDHVKVDGTDGIDGVDGNDLDRVDGVAPEADGPASPVITGSGTKRAPEKYFIIKSLTLHDLEQSIRTGIWATQAHNEDALNDAFKSADNVFLVFSANKSGEYFGYARMASTIASDSTSTVHRSIPSSQGSLMANTNAPRTIPTPATETAPKGAIIDDSARGTIFWEADLSDDDIPKTDQDGGDVEKPGPDDQAFGKPFRVEWMSTNRLPFYRTRGLRNSWNANREVKIARDGTELEPGVGKRLVSLFHRPAAMNPS